MTSMAARVVKPPNDDKLPAKGDVVDVEGTLQKMPPAQGAIQQFGIDPALEKQVGQELVYLEAKSVSASKLEKTGMNPKPD